MCPAGVHLVAGRIFNVTGLVGNTGLNEIPLRIKRLLIYGEKGPPLRALISANLFSGFSVYFVHLSG